MSKKKTATDLELDAIAKIVQSDEWQKRCDPTTIGADASQRQFVENRLSRTLNEGIDAGRKIERQLMLQRFATLFVLDLDDES